MSVLLKSGCRIFSTFFFLLNPPYVKSIDLSARSAVIICADSRDIIFSKNHTEHRAMASTTKIMSALLALEEAAARGERDLQISEEMVRVEGSSMGLRAGDLVSLETLVRGMLLPSGNDAANVTAISVCGSIDKFVKRMNDRAKEIGMKDTLFCTPSGLDVGDHHSTAIDMAILGAYAMENELFAKIASEKTANVKVGDRSIWLTNHNKLLKLYPYCIGIKTGFTEKAGRCLVSCAEKNNIRLVCVTLNAPDDWNDHIKLYEYGFSHTKSITFDDTNECIKVDIKNGESPAVDSQGATSFSRTFQSDNPKVERKIQINDNLCAPIVKGQCLGKINYLYNGNIIGSNLLISKDDVKVLPKKNIFVRIAQSILGFFKNIFLGISKLFKH